MTMLRRVVAAAFCAAALLLIYGAIWTSGLHADRLSQTAFVSLIVGCVLLLPELK